MEKIKTRAQDVPYMTRAWKEAIRNKRKFAKRFSRNKYQVNLKLKGSVGMKRLNKGEKQLKHTRTRWLKI